MENNLDNFLKNKMSVNEMGMEDPDISLIAEARKKVMARKRLITEKPNFVWMLTAFFNPKFKLLYTALASLLIIFGIFYILKQKNNKNNFNMSEFSSKKSSVNSSTVLASLTQYTLNNTSVNSSTVLSSIMTFVVRN